MVRPAIADRTDLGRGYGEIGAVVLADAEEVDADLVGEHRLVDDVADHLGVRQQAPVRRVGDVAESVQPEFKLLCHAVSVRCGLRRPRGRRLRDV